MSFIKSFEKLGVKSSSNVGTFDFMKEVKSTSKNLLTNKNEEIVQVKQKIEDIKDEAFGISVPVYKANELMQEIEAEKALLKELQSQYDVYEKFVDKVLDDCLLTEDLTELQQSFELESKRFEASLPIYAKKNEIIETVDKWPVTILTAETGSGKSTQVVQYLQQSHPDATIVCTQPRKVAAMSLANRVSEELETDVGDLVGYCVGARADCGPGTRIVYMTDHMLLNECLNDPNLSKYEYVIVDEAHERSISTDLLLAMIKKAIVKRRGNLKLVISSATIDPTIFSDYFLGFSKRLHVSGRTYPVEALYEKVTIGMNYLQVSVTKAKELHKNEDLDGDVLVFLTTPAETERAQELMNADPIMSAGVQCLVLHGRLQPEDQQLVFKPTRKGKRKIVFATNSAETSITIPNIKYVIDSGMVKEKHYDREKNASLLTVRPVNKSSAEQRMGRAGRTQPGKCYRLYTDEEYREMQDEMLPEILRENLGLAMLKLYEFDIGDPFKYDFVQAPPEQALMLAKQELKDLGAIKGNRLTNYGKMMAKLDIEPKLGKFVSLCIEEGYGYDAMVIAAVCSIGGSVFFRVGTEDVKQLSDRLKTRFCDIDGDLYTYLEVYKEWSEAPETQKNSWCVANSMNAKSLRFTRDLINDMVKNVKPLGHVILKRLHDLEEVKEIVPRYLTQCFPASLAYYSGHPRGGYYITGYEPERFYMHPSAALSFLNRYPKWILFTEILTTSRTYLINTIDIPEWLANRVNTKSVQCCKQWIVGREMAKALGFGKVHCHIEKKLQSDISQNIYIDFDSNNGKVSLFSTPEFKYEAVSVLSKVIDFERKCLANRPLEIPLSDHNTTCVVIGQGGACSTLLYSGEFSGLLIRGLAEDVERNHVEDALKVFGKVVDVVKFFKSYWWGKIIFAEPQSAVNALRMWKQRLNLDPEFDKAYFKAAFNQNISQSGSGNQSCGLKATWTRRPAKGDFAFVQFQNQTMFDEIRGTSKYIAGKHYTFKRSPREPLSVKMIGISQHASQEELKLSIENQFPHIVVTKCIIPRQPPVPVENQAEMDIKKRQLINLIRRSVDDAKTFRVEMKPVAAKQEVDYEAKIWFTNARDCHAVLNSNVAMGLANVRFTPELKSTPIHLPVTVYFYVKTELEDYFKRMRNVKMKENNSKRNNTVEIVIEAKKIEDLRDASRFLHTLAKGEQVQCSERQFRYFMTPLGREFIQGLKLRYTCDIRIEPRQRAIVIFGLAKERKQLKEEVEKEKLAHDTNDEIWIENFNQKPIGFIKHLIKKYGISLDRLYRESKISYININFLRHAVEFHGSKESIIKCQEAVRELTDKLHGRTVDRQKMDDGQCPICFDVLETKSHQLEICSHSYCIECFSGMCQHAIKNKDLPLSCARDDCDEKISIHDMAAYLDAKDIVPVAIERFVGDNPKKYKYCITPDCINVYRVSEFADPEDAFHCLMCQVQICTYCHKEYHAGLTCRFESRRKDDNLREWLAEDKQKRGLCPGCSAPIERFDGCMHIQCLSCRKHVCWRCKTAVFASSNECYDHMSRCGAGGFN